MPTGTFSVAGENAKFLIVTATPLTGASGASVEPVLGGLMGMLMLGIGEVAGAVPVGCPGAEAPGIPAT
ncbi:hypothetical protein [Streptomyces broussonetiae]|uniref:hypothetical protein n=1 Tax=Streptomyces broussonetiae TaxID=2686304 RepID=UPI001E594C19|nr:hypothetical protein [Streptomyces broussonetiae]